MNILTVIFLPLILSQVLGQKSTNEILQEEIGELKQENAELKIQVDALESRINEVHPICPIKKSNVFSIEGRVKGGLIS